MWVLSSAASPFFPRLQRSNSATHFLPAFCMLKSTDFTNARLPALPNLNFRFGKFISLHERQRPTIVFASEADSSDKGSLEEKTGGDAQGPPLLTILAGLVVLLFICWILGSIVLWLIGLILKPLS